jgi:hypothetical protein
MAASRPLNVHPACGTMPAVIVSGRDSFGIISCDDRFSCLHFPHLLLVFSMKSCYIACGVILKP